MITSTDKRMERPERERVVSLEETQLGDHRMESNGWRSRRGRGVGGGKANVFFLSAPAPTAEPVLGLLIHYIRCPRWLPGSLEEAQ